MVGIRISKPTTILSLDAGNSANNPDAQMREIKRALGAGASTREIAKTVTGRRVLDREAFRRTVEAGAFPRDIQTILGLA